jgi:hypothetical protein
LPPLLAPCNLCSSLATFALALQRQERQVRQVRQERQEAREAREARDVKGDSFNSKVRTAYIFLDFFYLKELFREFTKRKDSPLYFSYIFLIFLTKIYLKYSIFTPCFFSKNKNCKLFLKKQKL